MVLNTASEISKDLPGAFIDHASPQDGENRSPSTSTIILAIRTISELWCRLLRE
jgi:hypothetical protein